MKKKEYAQLQVAFWMAMFIGLTCSRVPFESLSHTDRFISVLSLVFLTGYIVHYGWLVFFGKDE